MQTLLDYAKERNRKVFRLNLRVLTALSLILSFSVLGYSFFSRTEPIFKGIKENLRYLLNSGDVQIERQISFLVSGSEFDFAWLKLNPTYNSGKNKSFAVSSLGQTDRSDYTDKRVFFSNYSLYWVHRIDIDSYHAKRLGTLYLAQTLPLYEGVSFLLIFLLINLLFLRMVTNSQRVIIGEIARPIRDFSLLLDDLGVDFDKVRSIETLSSDRKFLEIEILKTKFQDLWSDKLKAEELSKNNLKDTLEVKIGSHLRHDLEKDFFVIDAALTKVSGPDMAMSQIKLGLERARNTVRGFQKFARLEIDDALKYFSTGGNPVKQEILPIINEVKAEIDFLVNNSDKSIDFSVEILDDELPTVLFQSNSLKRALLNFLRNSFDAIKMEGSISISVRQKVNGVEIVVSDTGEGISESLLSKVGEEGFSTKPHGTGIGVSSSISKIKKWGGDVSFQSALNQGTQVTLSLVGDF